MLSEDQKKALKILTSIDPNICVGGSVCLNAYGLMDRKVGDLDIFVNRDKPFNITKFRLANDFDRDYDFTTDFNGDTLDRIPLLISGVKVCLFKVPPYLTQSLRMKVDGLELNIQNPCFAIAGKVLFSKHDEKHTKDLALIQNKLLNLNLNLF